MSEEKKVLMYLDMRESEWEPESGIAFPDFVPIKKDVIFWSGECPDWNDRFPYNVIRELMPDWWNEAYNDKHGQEPNERAMIGIRESSIAKRNTAINFCFEYPWDVEVSEKSEKLAAQLTTVAQLPAW